MTKIEVLKREGRIVGYKATGHSGYADYGKDIVCAALSSIMQYPLVGMLDVLEVYPKYDIDADGYLKVNLESMPTNGKDREINVLLDSMVTMIIELSKLYPKNIKLVIKEEQ